MKKSACIAVILLIFSFSKFTSNHIDFAVSEFFPGTKYNDTCITELDFYMEGFGWLFGEVDE